MSDPLNEAERDIETVPRLALTRSELAKALGVSDRIVTRLLANRKSGVPVVRLPGCSRPLFPVEAVREWLSQLQESQGQRGQQNREVDR